LFVAWIRAWRSEAKLQGDELRIGGRGVRHVHSAGQGILGRRINEVKSFVKIFVFIHVNLLNPIVSARMGAEGHQMMYLTVTTGPKISSLIVIERGSFVRMTVGCTK